MIGSWSHGCTKGAAPISTDGERDDDEDLVGLLQHLSARCGVVWSGRQVKRLTPKRAS